MLDSDKDYIRELVSIGATPEEQAKLRRECAEFYHVSLQTIAAITAWTKIRANQAGRTDSVQNDDEQPRESASIKTVSERGEHFDYDNEIKRAWRKKLQEFVAEHTDPKKRERMRVLCLPGKQCLEIPLYLELGFRPEKILGVEGGDKKARAEFQENARKYGIRAVTGQLEDVLTEEKQPFDVVSLDFTGPICETNLNILQRIYPAGKTLVVANYLAKRENKQTAKRLGKRTDMATYIGNTKTYKERIEFEWKLEQPDYKPGIGLQISRQEAMPLILRRIGFLREEIKAPYLRAGNYRAIESSFLESKAKHPLLNGDFESLVWWLKKYVLSMFNDSLIGTLPLDEQQWDSLMFVLDELYTTCMYGTPLLANMRNYEYVNPNGSRYFSDFMQVDSNAGLQQSCKQTMLFFHAAILYFTETFITQKKIGKGEITQPKFIVAPSRGGKKLGTNFPGQNMEILCVDPSGNVISQIDAATILRDALLVSKVWKESRNIWMAQKGVREKICL